MRRKIRKILARRFARAFPRIQPLKKLLTELTELTKWVTKNMVWLEEFRMPCQTSLMMNSLNSIKKPCLDLKISHPFEIIMEPTAINKVIEEAASR